jgi:hypothetical protein
MEGLKMEEQNDVAETPAEFLSQLGKTLREQKDTDAALADLVSSHLLKVDPGDACVANLRAAILKLAESRVGGTTGNEDHV